MPAFRISFSTRSLRTSRSAERALTWQGIISLADRRKPERLTSACGGCRWISAKCAIKQETATHGAEEPVRNCNAKGDGAHIDGRVAQSS